MGIQTMTTEAQARVPVPTPIPATKNLRDSVRTAVQVYMSRTGMSIGEIAEQAGFARQTVGQFVSSARFGTPATRGEDTAHRLAEWLGSNPAPLPAAPGRLYETEATRAMDDLLEHGREGGWGALYGPAGAQKTFFLECRWAEAAREPEPWLALVQADQDLSPRGLLGRVAQALWAPYAQYTDALRKSILYTLGRRKNPVALVIDEAQLLYSRIDTLETLRRLGDHARGKLGIIVCGNERVEDLFEARRKNYFEQWRSRIEQETVRVLGPTVAEARKMLAAEGVDSFRGEFLIENCVETDPVGKKKYVSARRLFNAIRADRREMRREQRRKTN